MVNVSDVTKTKNDKHDEIQRTFGFSRRVEDSAKSQSLIEFGQARESIQTF